MKYPSVSLVVPCFNEANRLAKAFSGLDDFVYTWKGESEVIMVDDGSTDESCAIILQKILFQGIQQQQEYICVQQKNRGKGGALQAGVAVATKDFILTLDTDMATLPLELFKWLESKGTFSEHEVLIGSRDLKTSQVTDSKKRKFVGNVFNFIIRKTIGLNVYDTQCGFKLYPARIAKEVFAKLRTPGWAHDVEILLRSKKMGCKIIEMPVTWKAMRGSKINVWIDSFKMFWEVMRIWSMRI